MKKAAVKGKGVGVVEGNGAASTKKTNPQGLVQRMVHFSYFFLHLNLDMIHYVIIIFALSRQPHVKLVIGGGVKVPDQQASTKQNVGAAGTSKGKVVDRSINGKVVGIPTARGDD